MRGPDRWSAGGTPVNMPQPETPEKIEDRRAGDPVARDGQNDRVRLGQRVQHNYIRPAAKGEPGQEGFFPAPVLAALGISAVAGALLGLLVGVLLFNARIVIPGWEVLYATKDITFHALWVLIGLSAGVVIGGAAVILMAPDHS